MIAVAIEAPHGPVVEILLERRFQVDTVNPKQLDRFRDRHTVAGAKDDRRDAYRLANRVREQLWRYCPQALELGDDLAADWFLDLWALAPTPAKAARLREISRKGRGDAPPKRIGAV